MSTHYTTLELPEQATATEIRRAYLRLVKLTHPDRTPDPAAHRRYLSINEAYEVLSQPERRQQYDASLQRQRNPPLARAAPAGSGQPGRRAAQARERRRPRSATGAASPGPAFISYQRYARAARRWCWVLLLLPTLVLLDYALLRRTGPAEFRSSHVEKNHDGTDSYEWGTTQGKFWTTKPLADEVAVVRVRCSPLTHTVFAVWLPNGTPVPIGAAPGGLAYLSVILLGLAGWGISRSASALTSVNVAIVVGLLEVILLLIVLKRF